MRLPLRELQELADRRRHRRRRPWPPPCARPWAACLRLRRPRRASVDPRGELLARPLGLDARPVLRPQRRCLRRCLQVVGGRHPRGRRDHPGVDHGSRHAGLGEDRDGRLADSHLSQQLLEVVEVGLREGRDGRLERLRVVWGERAQRVLDSVAELSSTSAGTSFGVWVTKKTPTPFERISRTVCATESRKALRRAVEQQMRLVEEEDQLRLVAGRPPRAAPRTARPRATSARSRTGRACPAPRAARGTEIMPRPSGAVRSRSAMSSCGSPKNSLPPPSSSPTSARSSTPTVAEREPADALQLALALVGLEEGQQRAQVREVEQRQALGVGVVEHEARGSAPGSRWRRGSWPAAAGRSPRRVARTGTPGPMPPSDRNSTGKPVGLERKAEVLHPLLRRAAGLAGRGEPGDVALHVGDEDRHPGRRQLLRHALQRLGLARAGRACDQPVAVHHGERQPGRPPPARLRLVHTAAERRSRGRRSCRRR